MSAKEELIGMIKNLTVEDSKTIIKNWDESELKQDAPEDIITFMEVIRRMSNHDAASA